MATTRSSLAAQLTLAVALTPLGLSAAFAAEDTRLPDGPQIIQFLDQTISWSRQRADQQQIATDTADLNALSNARQDADQIVRLAFDFARAAAALLDKPSNAAADAAAGPGASDSLKQLQTRIDKHVQDTQAELDDDRHQLVTATPSERETLRAKVSELQAELELATVRRDAVRSMVEFAGGAIANASGAAGLRAQIETLADSVGATSRDSSAHAAASNPPIAIANKADGSGILDLTALVFSLSRKVRLIDLQIQQTEDLQGVAKTIRAPYVAQLKLLVQQGDQLAAEADTADQSQLAQERVKLDAFAVKFRQIAAAAIPLRKQRVLLDLYQRDLAGWRNEVSHEYQNRLRALGIHIAVLALILALAIGAGELWRRAAFRYVHEPRRRHQLLLLRRFVLWPVIAVVLASALVSRLDSFLTFAGLLTAGVAVALQNVVLSMVGYFFLIGKYGIRVGDRVQIGDVVGDVIEIGMVRLQLMELRGGSLSGPTGRVVGFPNSIVFQASIGLFKQIPGISFAWHEVTLMLAPGADFVLLKDRLMKTVEAVLANYKDEIERQNRTIERTAVSESGNSLHPRVQLRYMSGGIEATIRYPVDLQHATEIDGRVSQELLQELDREPKVLLASARLPDVKPRTGLVTP